MPAGVDFIAMEQPVAKDTRNFLRTYLNIILDRKIKCETSIWKYL